MSGPKRTADKLNTIGIVVVGICSAVLVYVTIVALQAFYMNDTSEVQTMADYGGQDTQAKHIRATQTENITRSSTPNAPPTAPGGTQTYRIPIATAMRKIAEEAKSDSGNLIPVHGRSECRTVLPIFGRPRTDEKPPCAPPSPAPAAPAPAAPAAPAMTPTGGTGPGGGPLPGQGSGTTGQGAGSAEKGNGR